MREKIKNNFFYENQIKSRLVKIKGKLQINKRGENKG